MTICSLDDFIQSAENKREEEINDTKWMKLMEKRKRKRERKGRERDKICLVFVI